MQESFSWRHLCKFRDALNVIIFPILCMWWQIMDAHGNYQPRKEISLKSIPSTRRDFFSTWTLNCGPVCFSNSLSQHVVVNKEKVILWWHLNSGSASASWGASVHYKPLRQYLFGPSGALTSPISTSSFLSSMMFLRPILSLSGS